MHPEHQLALDDVFLGAVPFCILDYCFAGIVIPVDEIGPISTAFLNQLADRLPFRVPAQISILGRDEFESDLLAKVGDQSGVLHKSELRGTVVLLLGGMAANLPGMILIAFAGMAGSVLAAELINRHSFHRCRPPRS